MILILHVIIVEPMVVEHIAGTFEGDLVTSTSPGTLHAHIHIERLNESLVMIRLNYDQQTINFVALVIVSEDGQLLLIQEKTTDDHQLKGLKGFVAKFPNANGGLLYRMNNLFLNFEISYFNNKQEQFYFLGSPAT